jgi:polyisoprenoid-binding protein YceI
VQRIKDDRYRIVGDLTIRGTTREVVLEGTDEGRGRDPWGGERLAFSASATIDRRDFGLTWNQALETGGVLVSNEIKISIDVQAVKAA